MRNAIPCNHDDDPTMMMKIHSIAQICISAKCRNMLCFVLTFYFSLHIGIFRLLFIVFFTIKVQGSLKRLGSTMCSTIPDYLFDVLNVLCDLSSLMFCIFPLKAWHLELCFIQGFSCNSLMLILLKKYFNHYKLSSAVSTICEVNIFQRYQRFFESTDDKSDITKSAFELEKHVVTVLY